MKIAILIRVRSDGQYVAHCPSLPGCTTRANTRESVEHKMREAVVGYLASMDVVLPAKVIVAEVQETRGCQETGDAPVDCGTVRCIACHPTRRAQEMKS